MKVWIMRGLPGSGKSTWIKDILPSAFVCSADKFHMVNGKYQYDPKKAGDAHEACLREFVDLIVNGSEIDVVVDNTNTTAVELAPYVRLCQAFRLDFEIVYIHCSLEASWVWNIHNVPFSTLMAMNANLLTEKLPWPQTVRFIKR